MTHIVIEDNMFGQKLHIVINCSDKEFTSIVYKRTKVKIKTDSDTDGSYFIVSDDKNDSFSYVHLKKFDKDTESISLLIHELYHHVHRSLKDLGIKNEETTAYYLQHFVRGALTKLV